MKSYQGAIFILMAGLIISFLAFYGTYNIFYQPINPQGSSVTFTIHSGESLKGVAQRLEALNLIKNKDIFIAFGILEGMANHLKEGKYVFSPHDNLLQIIQEIKQGNALPAKVLVIKEGESLKDIQRALSKNFSLKKTLQQEKVKDWQKPFPFLDDAPAQATLEGYLFPDTYYFSQSSSLNDIVRKLLSRFQEKIEPLRSEITKAGGVRRIMIMASLLEKEVPGQEDKEIVAGIIEKRIKIKMPIQIDASVHYALDKKTPLSKKDTLIDSPYNTYRHLGLPPGPICNPGLESIKAALHPLKSSYLYYLTTPERKVIFSRTLREHNIAKAKYYPKK